MIGADPFRGTIERDLLSPDPTARRRVSVTAMTLDQLHDLKLWHQRHLRDRPVEKYVWDAVLTLWLIGWVGGPVAFLIHRGWAAIAAVALVFLPGAYVALRRTLHRARILRCDWISALH